MRITHFDASNVHGYLPLKIDFHPNLTFLTGLNGTGKTSALKLLMALLTPNIEDFVSTEFSTASATIRDSGEDVVISATKATNQLELKVSRISEKLELSAADMQLIMDSRRREMEKMPIQDRIISHPVIIEISKLSTPIFLGLDRRFTSTPYSSDDLETRRRDFMLRRSTTDDSSLKNARDLADVNYLVSEALTDIRTAQEILDAELRKRILTGAFQYKHSEFHDQQMSVSLNDLSEYRKRQESVELAAQQLKLPLTEVQGALTTFFEKMNSLVTRLESLHSGTTSGHDGTLVEWLMNKSQVDRILAHIRLLDDFNTKRAKLHEPIERFLKLVNGFLVQTNKELQMTERGDLKVVLAGYDTKRSLTALSSGERQLVVMLGHLALNKSLAGSSVFIVDEPELSLHIGWQERFVDAIQQANSSVQLIMATHSPAIILDRLENCRTLTGDR